MQLRFPHNPNEICSTRLRSRNAQVYGILFSLSQVMLLNKTLHVLAKKAIETTDHPYCSNMPMQRWIFVTPFSHVKLPEFVELLAYLLQCYPSYDYSSGILGSGPKEFWVANLPPKCQVMLKDLKQNELRMDMLFFWRRLPQTQITINWGSQWPLKICQTCFFKPVLLVLGESANLKSMSTSCHLEFS